MREMIEGAAGEEDAPAGTDGSAGDDAAATADDDGGEEEGAVGGKEEAEQLQPPDIAQADPTKASKDEKVAKVADPNIMGAPKPMLTK